MIWYGMIKNLCSHSFAKFLISTDIIWYDVKAFGFVETGIFVASQGFCFMETTSLWEFHVKKKKKKKSEMLA